MNELVYLCMAFDDFIKVVLLLSSLTVVFQFNIALNDIICQDDPCMYGIIRKNGEYVTHPSW